jgi:hypothetical protein
MTLSVYINALQMMGSMIGLLSHSCKKIGRLNFCTGSVIYVAVMLYVQIIWKLPVPSTLVLEISTCR